MTEVLSRPRESRRAFRSRVFLVLAIVGFVPLLVLGWLSFSVNRAELETIVGRAHEAATVLRIPYRQLDAVEAIALLDEGGNALVPPLIEGKPGAQQLDQQDLDLFARHVLLAYAAAAGTADFLYLAAGTGTSPVRIYRAAP